MREPYPYVLVLHVFKAYCIENALSAEKWKVTNYFAYTQFISLWRSNIKYL